jgi:capsid protein
MMFDSTQANTVLSRLVDTQVDTGLRFESAPIASLLGISEQEAERKGEEISQRFALWCESPQSVASETGNYYQYQHLAATYQHRENESFLRLMYSADPDLMNPLQVQPIDPDQITGVGYTYTDGIQNNTHDGIERNSSGKEIAYWVLTQQANGDYKQVRIPAIGQQSKRRLMLHAYKPSFAGQGRGYSEWAHALQDYQNINDFWLAHIKKAINQSQIPIYVKPSNNADAHNPMGHLSSQRSGAVNFDAVTPAAGPDDTIVEFTPLPEATMDVPGSTMIFSLKKGEDLKVGDQNAPIDTFDRFMDASMTYLGASKGMPIEIMQMKFGENYSASRATFLLFWNLLRMYRGNSVAQTHHPVFMAWFAEEIAAGRLRAPGWRDPLQRAAWGSGRWNGTPLPNIDPLQMAKANEINASLGATHLDTIARETNGSDGRVNRAKLNRQIPELTLLPKDAQPVPSSQGEQNVGAD